MQVDYICVPFTVIRLFTSFKQSVKIKKSIDPMNIKEYNKYEDR